VARGLILYLHGFRSSPGARKSRLLGEAMAERGLAEHFLCPSLSPVPAQAMADVSAQIENAQAQGRGPVTLVGSSLGGHYASYLAARHGLRAVLINPAAVDRLDPDKFVGEHRYLHGEDSFVFTREHAAQLRAQVLPPPVGDLWLLLETGDEVLDYRQAQAFWLGCRQTVLEGGDHSFTRFPEFIPQILEYARL